MFLDVLDDYETRYLLCCTLRHVHLIATKHILRYLKGIVDYGLNYEANQEINLEVYVDLDWDGSSIDMKRNMGCFLSMGLGVIS